MSDERASPGEAFDEALHESEERHRIALDAARLGTWRHDLATNQIDLDARGRAHYGLDEATVPLDAVVARIHPDDRERVAREIGAVLDPAAGLERWSTEYRVVHPSGEARWLSVHAHLRFAGEGDARRTTVGYGTTEDITEQKRAAEERERLLRAAEEATRVRDDFVSLASHELRTPLAVLTLQLAGLERRAAQAEHIASSELLRRLEVMGRQIARLSSLVDDLLDVSRITTGRLEVAREPVDVAALVRVAAARHGPALQRAGCALSLEAPPSLVARIDAARMEQVLDGLLANAAKYGAGEPVEVSLAAADDGARLVVRDFGIGISAEDQRRIFGRFERVAPSQHYSGLGLGLWIVRQLVEAMGGAIAVESAPGEGATFTVTLPVDEPGEGA